MPRGRPSTRPKLSSRGAAQRDAALRGGSSFTRFDRVRHAKGGSKTGTIRRAMQRAMHHHCAVFRAANVLEQGLREMAKVARAPAWRDDTGQVRLGGNGFEGAPRAADFGQDFLGRFVQTKGLGWAL